MERIDRGIDYVRIKTERLMASARPGQVPAPNGTIVMELPFASVLLDIAT
jgi:hypothetical protein